MSERQITWIGLQIEDYLIDELLGEGSFAWVYRGVSLDGREPRAFKVAKHPEFIGKLTAADSNRTEAKFVFTGGVTNVTPDAGKLLALQSATLEACADPALVRVEKLVQKDDRCYCVLELLEGKTLRAMMGEGAVPLATLVEISSALDRLSQDPFFTFHGDLKPDNIMITDSGVKIFDPGYFGAIDCQEGASLDCAITTTAYYPLLEPDDLLAFGIMLWEWALGRHPFSGPDTRDETEESKLGAGLLDWVRRYEAVGQYFLSPLAGVSRPRGGRPDIHPELELLLLSGVRLRLTEDETIDSGEGFADFKQLTRALERLSQHDVDQL